MSETAYTCETETIAAFIEGDLEPDARLAFEAHIAKCDQCNTDLQAQRQFLCELESALATSGDLSVPKNFAKVVAVRAESDMRGLRDAAEHRKALRLCLVLALAAFALLGAASTKDVFINAQSMAGKALAVFGMLGKTLYNAVAGLGVILQMIGGGIIAGSRVASLTALLLVVFVVGLLWLLIFRYHRTRLSD